MRWVAAVAVLFAACADGPAMLEPEADCSSPWPPAGPWRPAPGVRPPAAEWPVHQFELHESDLPYDLAGQGIAIADRVSVVKDPPRPDGSQRPQRVVAYEAEDAWMVALAPDDVDWFGEGHLVEILLASRPGCTEQHAAVLLLFRGEPSG